MNIDVDKINDKNPLVKQSSGFLKKLQIGVLSAVVGAGIIVSAMGLSTPVNIDVQNEINSPRIIMGVPVPQDLMVHASLDGSSYKHIGGILGEIDHYVLQNEYGGYLGLNGVNLGSRATSMINIFSLMERYNNQQLEKYGENAFDSDVVNGFGEMNDNLKQDISPSDDAYKQAIEGVKYSSNIEGITINELHMLKSLSQYRGETNEVIYQQIKDGEEMPELGEVALALYNNQQELVERFNDEVFGRIVTGTSLSKEQAMEVMNQSTLIHELGHAYDEANHVSSRVFGNPNMEKEAFADLAKFSITAGVYAAEHDLPQDEVKTVLMRMSGLARSFLIDGDPHQGGSYSFKYASQNEDIVNKISQNAFERASKPGFNFERDMNSLYGQTSVVFNSSEFNQGLGRLINEGGATQDKGESSLSMMTSGFKPSNSMNIPKMNLPEIPGQVESRAGDSLASFLSQNATKINSDTGVFSMEHVKYENETHGTHNQEIAEYSSHKFIGLEL